MIKMIACAALLGAAASSVKAQQPCFSGPVDVVGATPRSMVLELGDSTRRATALHPAGVACRADFPLLMAGRVESSGDPTVDARLFYPTGAFDLLGGLSDTHSAAGGWVGRGANLTLRAAAGVDIGRFHLVVAPVLSYAQNRAYDVLPATDVSRSSFSSPFYPIPVSIDLPTRHGIDPILAVHPGQSAAWVSAGFIDIGAATTTQRWGPGRRGGLVLGGSSPGIPRFYVRTPDAVGTRAGAWSGEVLVGTLTESRFFDADRTNDYRTLGAWTVAWSPALESAFRLGIAHATLRAGGLTQGAPIGGSGSDQINAVFAELGTPDGGGSRVYAEVARAGTLPSLRGFLALPYAGVAFLAGFEHVIERSGGSILLAGEIANLEQPTDVRGQPTRDFYTSSRVVQGWTQRGHVIGYPTGPGSNHQELSVDWVAPGWSAGVFGERTRLHDDALYRQPLAYPWRHDVAVRAGVRGGFLVAGVELALEASLGRRLNYMFQNDFGILGYRSVDVATPQLRMRVTPQLRAAR